MDNEEMNGEIQDMGEGTDKDKPLTQNEINRLVSEIEKDGE